METLRTLHHRFDASFPGRRLDGRLRRAGLECPPSIWVLGSSLTAICVFAIFVTAGASPLVGLLWAVASVRFGSRIVLGAFRRRHRGRVDQAAIEVARMLSAATAPGCGLAEAIIRSHVLAAHECEELAARVLHRAASGVALGEDPATAVARGAALVRGDQRAGQPDRLDVVTAVVAVHADHARGRAASLARVADIMEVDGATVREARAHLSEARMVVIAIPLLSLAIGAVITTTTPSAVAVADTPWGGSILTACAMLVTIGIAASWRATRLNL